MSTGFRQLQQYQQLPSSLYACHTWPVDNKPLSKEEDDLSGLEDEIAQSATPTTTSTDYDPHNRSLNQYQRTHSRASMWLGPSPQLGYQIAPQPTQASTLTMLDTSGNQYPQDGVAREGPYGPHTSWPPAATSTVPVQPSVYDPVGQGFPTIPYNGSQINLNQASYSTDPFPATPMSPQSSQSGWMSTASSDGTEPRPLQLQSPEHRAISPDSHMKHDGIRKKNARFEIPAERNLNNIDSLILQTADEQEKKELKQQKRLLRNRQAALDSRQRKKQHTEKLEQEKKDFNQHLTDLQDENRRLQAALQRESAMWHQQQQEYQHFIQTVSFERDEAIRTKTLETAELRKMNKILKDHIRDYERREYEREACINDNQQQTVPSDGMLPLHDLDMGEGGWNDNFLVLNEDLNDRPSDITPTPQQDMASGPVVESKPDAPFSWNAFYMCLLFGAFIASKSNNTNSAPAVPPLSEEYRAESANVLKAVLTAGPNNGPDLFSSPSTATAVGSADRGGDGIVQAATVTGLEHLSSSITGSEMAQLAGQPSESLQALHQTLVAPTRRQRETEAFSLSAESYQHLTDPDSILPTTDGGGGGGADDRGKPSRLETAFNAMQESRQKIDDVMNRSRNEKSSMWERVPEKVLQDFRRMVEDVERRR